MNNHLLKFIAGSVVMSVAGWTHAAKELKSGEFTVVKNQVEHTLGTSKSLAKIKDPLEEKSLVDTGAASLTELGFDDASVLRLGANTQFSFQSKERIIKLDQGTMLMNVPPGNGGITVDGGGVTGTGAVSGTTIMASRDEAGNFSFMILEGQGGGKVTGKDGVSVNLIPGQMAIVRQDGQPTKVVEVNVDAMRDHSPLFTDFPARMPGTDDVQATTDRQANEVQNEILFLQSLKEQGLEDSGPGSKALAMLTGMNSNEIDNSRNILLGDSTAAGQEGAEKGSGEGSLVAVNNSSAPADARQAEAEPLIAATMLVSAGTLADETTAAGVETAAGGGGGADTQVPGLTTPLPFTPTGVGGGGTTTGGTTSGTPGGTTGTTTGGTTGTTTGGTTGTTTGGTTSGTPGGTTGTTTGGTTGTTTGGTTGTTTGGTTSGTPGGTTGTTTGGTTGTTTGGTTGTTTGGTTGTTTGGTTGTTTGGTTGTTTGGTTGTTTGGTTGTTTGGTTGTTTGGTTGTTTGGTTGNVPTPPNPNPPTNYSPIPPVFSSPVPGFTTPI